MGRVVRQTERPIIEQLVPQPRVCEVEVAVGNFKRYKWPNVCQIPTELFQGRGENLHWEIHKLIKLICRKDDSPYQC
jgi:hypothetical protein